MTEDELWVLRDIHHLGPCLAGMYPDQIISSLLVQGYISRIYAGASGLMGLSHVGITATGMLAIMKEHQAHAER